MALMPPLLQTITRIYKQNSYSALIIFSLKAVMPSQSQLTNDVFGVGEKSMSLTQRA